MYSAHQTLANFEIGRICISNPKSEILDWTGCITALRPIRISDFGFEMQDSSNFEIPLLP